MLHRADISLHVDFVINHNGFSDVSTPGFVAAGGYPGLAVTLPNDIDGDFHSAFAGAVDYGGWVIDIAHFGMRCAIGTLCAHSVINK